MNHFYLESRGKEKARDLMNEGIRSQAYRRSGASRARFISKLPKFILIVLGILGVLQVIAR